MTPLQRYDTERECLIGKSADGLYPLPPVAYWSIAHPKDKRQRKPWRRRIWRWLMNRIPW